MDRLSFRSTTDAAGFTILSNLVLLDAQLSDGAKVTYLLLLHHARQAGSCFPGQDTLAQERGTSSRSIRSHLSELTQRGLITAERRGQGRSNLYWLESLEAVYGAKEAAQEAIQETGADAPGEGQSAADVDRKKTATQGKSGDDRKKTSGLERKNSSAPIKHSQKDIQNQESETLNVRQRGKVHAPGSADVERIIGLTQDAGSRRRFEQLYAIAQRHGCLGLWDEAVESLKKRLKKQDDPLRSPGAYFGKTLSDLLGERGVSVPVGSKAEREDVRGQLRASLGLED